MLPCLRKRCETEAGLAAGLREPRQDRVYLPGPGAKSAENSGRWQRHSAKCVCEADPPSYYKQPGESLLLEQPPGPVPPTGAEAAAGLPTLVPGWVCSRCWAVPSLTGCSCDFRGAPQRHWVEDPDFPPGDPLPGLAPKCPFPGEAISFHLSIKAQTWKMSFFSY